MLGQLRFIATEAETCKEKTAVVSRLEAHRPHRGLHRTIEIAAELQASADVDLDVGLFVGRTLPLKGLPVPGDRFLPPAPSKSTTAAEKGGVVARHRRVSDLAQPLQHRCGTVVHRVPVEGLGNPPSLLRRRLVHLVESLRRLKRDQVPGRGGKQSFQPSAASLLVDQGE